MRIAQVAPLYEAVPPQTYGGTERIVHYLTEALVELGHEVTLFASADSKTSANLVPGSPPSLRLHPCVDPMIHHSVMLEKVYRMRRKFDIVHFHVDYLHFPRSRAEHLPHVTTLHGKLSIPDLVPLYEEFGEMPVISISNSQRQPLPWLNWVATVHHGLPVNLYSPNYSPEGYLAFLGRISPEKGLDRAIEIAKRTGHRLKIAAKVDAQDKVYFETYIRPLLQENTGFVEYIGEIDDRQKAAFLGNAKALLFPIQWEEPFGLVMIEALACATPIIAFRRGSVMEVLADGETGYSCDTVDEACHLVHKIDQLDRRSIRAVFDRRFTSLRMAEDYLVAYRQMEFQKAAPIYKI